MSKATRPTLNGKGMSWQWDKTSHGGIVLTGFEHSTWNDGIRQARLGDMVFCPKCKPHKHTIAQVSGMNVHGVQSALEGDLTSCGAVLLAERASPQDAAAAQRFMDGTGFDDRYVLRNTDGQVMTNTYYAAQKSDGAMEYGTTDETGHTHFYLTGEDSEQITFYIAG
ncbi:PAAR domain-containing protein [Limnohabitans sp. DM1]|uniref:PAAR domain-containing protein n=1 Tax=Limnohabitans sp. DM1 TaxID=1597955 RepID=UPI000AF07028|nr:PAAR domain-containing protein [Limnohabitans sp. DM1]